MPYRLIIAALAVAALALTAADAGVGRNAQPGPGEVAKVCDVQGKQALLFMSVRQRGVDRSLVLGAIGSRPRLREIISDAYRFPQLKTDDRRHELAADFSRAWASRCRRDWEMTP